MKNIASCLVERGYSVTVICFRQSDDQPDQEEIEGQTLIRVSTRLMDLRNRADAELRLGESLAAKMLRLYTQVRRRLRLRIRTDALDRTLQEQYFLVLEKMEPKPDAVVPTCMPFEAVMAATEYKLNNRDVKLIPFLFDQYADSATLYASSRLRESRRVNNLLLEQEMLRASDSVLHITWEEHVKKEFPEFQSKLHHVEHPLLVRPKTTIRSDSNLKDSCLLYAGALSEGVRDPTYSLRLISACLELSNCLKGASFYVPNSKSAVHWFTPYQKNWNIELNDAVPSDVIGSLCASAEWLLSIGNSRSDQKISKIYEYMAIGKPIVHIAHDSDDQTARELERYPLSLCLYEESEFDENVQSLNNFLQGTKGKTVSFQETASYFREELPETVTDRLIQLIKGVSCG